MWAKKIFLKAFFLSFWAISVRAFFCQVFVFCIKVPPLNLRPAHWRYAVNQKKKWALWLKRLPCSRRTEMAIEMLLLTPGGDSFFEFREPRFP
jgi:hypothetical protein